MARERILGFLVKMVACSLVFWALAIFALSAWAQTSPHVHPRVGGTGLTFAWDHVGASFTCAPVAGGTMATHNFARGVNGSFVCNSRTYQLTWTANAASVPGYNADGSTWTGVYRYRYRGSLTPAGGQPAQALAGEVIGNGTPIELRYGSGDLVLEVQTIRTVGTQEEVSVWVKSTDPAHATVDGAARGWIVRVTDPAPPAPNPPGAISGMRLNP